MMNICSLPFFFISFTVPLSHFRCTRSTLYCFAIFLVQGLNLKFKVSFFFSFQTKQAVASTLNVSVSQELYLRNTSLDLARHPSLACQVPRRSVRPVPQAIVQRSQLPKLPQSRYHLRKISRESIMGGRDKR